MRRSRVRLLVAAPFWKDGCKNGENECALVFVTHNDTVMKAPYNENESRVERLWRTIGRGSAMGREIGCEKFGGVPERSKGSDCKSDGYAFEGSNPSPTTIFGERSSEDWPPKRVARAVRGYGSMVEPQPSKLKMRVRFPLPAPRS